MGENFSRNGLSAIYRHPLPSNRRHIIRLCMWSNVTPIVDFPAAPMSYGSPLHVRRPHLVLMSFVFVIRPTERAVLASYTMVVPACLHDQHTGANRQSELVIPNRFYKWFSLYMVSHAHS